MRPMNTSSKKSGRRTWRRGLTAGAAGLAVLLTAQLVERPAAAQEFTFHAEAAAGFFVDEPQMSRFTPGFYGAIRPGIALGPIVSLQLSYAMMLTTAGDGYTEDGSAHFLTLGFRLRPLATLMPDSDQLGGLFADFNMGYVRTQELDRFGFDVGLGYGFQVAPWFSLGPVLRYVQIVQPNDITTEDTNDAQIITIGIDFAFGPAHSEENDANCPNAEDCDKEDEEECETVVAVVEPVPCTAVAPLPCIECPDGDQDGVCDADDRCPMHAGPAATFGCPVDVCGGELLLLLVQFELDSATMPPLRPGDTQTMDPVLDAVADAIAQDSSCRVCIVGYTSEEGSAEHNQELSNDRAAAVQGYMTARGLPAAQVPTVGLGERCQLVPTTTLRLNRRVEFRRLHEGESCPTDCDPTYYRLHPTPAP
jgi:outer membrane protein OmpA-like peptidoglycan-associated protein